MPLSILSWITFFLLSILMGISNIYSTLLTGWGEGGSIVAVILCLLFLRKDQRTIINYNLGQTMASAGGSVGFTVAIMAAVYYIYAKDGIVWHPPLLDLSLLITALSLMAVSLAVPLRRYVVHWFFPAAVACSVILRAVTSNDQKERKLTQQVMGVSGLLAAVITIPTKIALSAGQPALLSPLQLGPRLSLSFDPLLYGIGVVVGTRIGFSILLGGLIHACVLEPQLQMAGVDIGEYTRWIAMGLMTLPTFSSLIFASIFQQKQQLPPGFNPKADTEEDRMNWKQACAVGAVFGLSLLLTIYEMHSIFQVSWGYVLLVSLVSGPLCFALGKVASETGITPVRLLAITLLLVVSLIEKHNPVGLLSIGVAGATFAAITVDLFFDLRTGYLIRANPKQQVIMQYLGVIPTAFACVYFLDFLAQNFGFGEGQYFPAPGIIIWATMADAFSGGAASIPVGAWYAASVASGVGILLSIFENWKPTQTFTPSTFALGIAILLPFEMSAAIFFGSLLRALVAAASRMRGKGNEELVHAYAFKSGSAVFAAASIAGIVAALLITFGVVYLPKS